MAPISLTGALTAALLASYSIAVPIASPFDFQKVSNGGFLKRSAATKYPPPSPSSGYHLPQYDRRNAPYAVPESNEKRSSITEAEPVVRDPETRPYQYFKRDASPASPVSKSYPSSGYHLPYNLKERSTAPYSYQPYGINSPEKRSTGTDSASPAGPSSGYSLPYFQSKREAKPVAHANPYGNAKLPMKPRSPKAVEQVQVNVEDPVKTAKEKRDQEISKRYAMAQWMTFPI
ncbi:MAG: hypothetical protein M1831_004740 [Alyxoria varia]|nr:MAG: hypothetical protein M1831_004740 [Alyxoria varia]